MVGVIARRPKADAAISSGSEAGDCHGLSGLAMTTAQIKLDRAIIYQNLFEAQLLGEYFDAVDLGVLYVHSERDNQLSIGYGQVFDCLNHGLFESAGFFVGV